MDRRPASYYAPGAVSRGGTVGGVDCGTCRIRDRALCSALDKDEIGRLEAIVRKVHLDPGQTLFYEGDPANYVYNVTAGALKLYKLLADGRRQITGFLFAADFVGLANTEGYSYGAEAVSAVDLCRFPWLGLNVLFDEFPKLERRLLGIADDELAAAQEQMVLLGRKSAPERVASFLLRLSERAKRHGRPESPVAIPMNRADIADFLGLTTETVSRTFSRFKRQGYIAASDSHRVALLRRDALRDLAEGV